MAAKKNGRPTKRSPEVIQRILDGLSKGTTLSAICREPGMPDPSNVWKWAQNDAELSKDIAHARNLGFDAIADECMEIANTPIEGIESCVGPDGERITRKDMLGHRKLQIETRLKLLAKWDPKRYGEKVDVNASHSGTLTVTIGGNA
jgi:hypothetical protein